MSCWCEDNTPLNTCWCSLIWADNTTIDTTSQPWDVIVSSPFYEVVSPLNTIEVHKVIDEESNTITFEIEKECCPDRYVWACENDTNPWVLFNDKLVVDTSWPLTYDLVNCPWDAHVRIWFDVSQLNAPDRLVAVNSSCSSKYLEESLATDDPTYFTFETVACRSVLTPKPRKLLRAEFKTLTESINVLQWQTTWFQWIDSTRMVKSTNMESAISEENLWWSSDYYTVTIPRDGWYQINMQWSYVCSGVHTIRNQIVRVDTWLLIPVLDSREEWGWRVDQDANDLINTQWELNTDIALAMHSDIAAANWEEMWISTFMRWHWFWGSTATFLTEWTQLTMIFKYNTIVKNTFTSLPEYTVVFTTIGTDLSTNWEWAGTWWSIIELPEYALTD